MANKIYTQTIFYRPVDFESVKVTFSIVDPSGKAGKVKSADDTDEDGVYRLECKFSKLGKHVVVVYENGEKKYSEVVTVPYFVG